VVNLGHCDTNRAAYTFAVSVPYSAQVGAFPIPSYRAALRIITPILACAVLPTEISDYRL
jgi:hypothetical protein